ncbi:hypothetical protein [Vulcanisaeta sp. JCM 16161]|uniref:hypothetical protein n=1 Tax=Vulcanisaeta sp. JCM 16161 TaxID=1295372 RepID=UPI001FB3AC22|nr:hypothetical protein [Vulcanisaeta sp. JCM 16161]
MRQPPTKSGVSLLSACGTVNPSIATRKSTFLFLHSSASFNLLGISVVLVSTAIRPGLGS